VASDSGGSPPAPGTSDAEIARGKRIGVGCFATFIGMWSGGMIAVLVGRFVGTARGCVPAEGLPACDWYWFALIGMILGAVTLPLLVLRRLSKKK
jgi:hypothetical protein